MKISELITDKYKLRMPPIVYYELLADVLKAEDEQELRWTLVCERLPEAGKEYLCCNKDGLKEIGYLSKVLGTWGVTDPEAFGDVIAWMPLPEPHNVESEDE